LLNALGVVALGLLGAGLWVSARNEAGATRYEVAVRRAVGASRRAVWTFYMSFASRRVLPALVAGAWLSLFLGAGLSEAYGSIPQIDWAVWAGAAAWVSAMYVLGSAPPFLRAANEPLLPTLNQSSSNI
jgi:ABC-type antimicrobial peptide transport system permease subunit